MEIKFKQNKKINSEIHFNAAFEVEISSNPRWFTNPLRSCFLDSPSATGRGQNTTTAVGTFASLSCPVDGNPEPNITWYRGSNACGTLMFNAKVLKFLQTALDDTGCYTCSASNYLGTVSITQCLVIGKWHIPVQVKLWKLTGFQVFFNNACSCLPRRLELHFPSKRLAR